MKNMTSAFRVVLVYNLSIAAAYSGASAKCMSVRISAVASSCTLFAPDSSRGDATRCWTLWLTHVILCGGVSCDCGFGETSPWVPSFLSALSPTPCRMSTLWIFLLSSPGGQCCRPGLERICAAKSASRGRGFMWRMCKKRPGRTSTRFCGPGEAGPTFVRRPNGVERKDLLEWHYAELMTPDSLVRSFKCDLLYNLDNALLAHSVHKV